MGGTRTITTDEFDAEIITSSKPSVVDFSATWCGPCQALAPHIDEMAKSFDGQVLISKVDVDQSPDLASRFGVMSVPTVLFFKDGEKVGEVRGNYPDKIREKIRELI